MTFPGRLLGIDHGLKVLGLAVCDPTGLVARPLRLLERASKNEDFATINALIESHEAAGVVVGLPESPPHIKVYTQADRVRLWAARLAAAVRVPVYLWNERYSTQDAQEIVAQSGKAIRIDDVAAAVILQSFLDALRDADIEWPEPVAPVAQ